MEDLTPLFVGLTGPGAVGLAWFLLKKYIKDTGLKISSLEKESKELNKELKNLSIKFEKLRSDVNIASHDRKKEFIDLRDVALRNTLISDEYKQDSMEIKKKVETHGKVIQIFIKDYKERKGIKNGF
jgi:hypothetical protein